MSDEMTFRQGAGPRMVVKITPEGTYWIAPDITPVEALEVLPSLISAMATIVNERRLAGIALLPTLKDGAELAVARVREHLKSCDGTGKTVGSNAGGWCCGVGQSLSLASERLVGALQIAEKLGRKSVI